MSRRPSPSELLAWTLVGAVVGVAAGFALGEWLGPLSRERAGRVLRGATGAAARKLTPSEAARAARLMLETDPMFKGLELVPIGVGPGIVELHGWVSTRALRARAMRLVSQTAGIDTLVNCLLVHGEDDAAEPAPDATDRPA
jgi:hypothetical protein